jgi:hypothetical protein
MWLVRWLSSAARRVRSAIGGRSAAAGLAISGFSPGPNGTYTVQVFVSAGGEAAQTECDPVTIEIR